MPMRERLRKPGGRGEQVLAVLRLNQGGVRGHRTLFVISSSRERGTGGGAEAEAGCVCSEFSMLGMGVVLEAVCDILFN
jgi:hypothetical protein